MYWWYMMICSDRVSEASLVCADCSDAVEAGSYRRTALPRYLGVGVEDTGPTGCACSTRHASVPSGHLAYRENLSLGLDVRRWSARPAQIDFQPQGEPLSPGLVYDGILETGVSAFQHVSDPGPSKPVALVLRSPSTIATVWLQGLRAGSRGTPLHSSKTSEIPRQSLHLMPRRPILSALLSDRLDLGHPRSQLIGIPIP